MAQYTDSSEAELWATIILSNGNYAYGWVSHRTLFEGDSIFVCEEKGGEMIPRKAVWSQIDDDTNDDYDGFIYETSLTWKLKNVHGPSDF
jgi:hypothetical protein